MIPRTQQSREKAAGYSMAFVGFLFILGNAADYLFDWGQRPVTLLIIGLVMVVTGMNLVRNRS